MVPDQLVVNKVELMENGAKEDQGSRSPNVYKEVPTIEMDTDEEQMEQNILNMDLFYTHKASEIPSQTLANHTEMLIEVSKQIAAKKLKKIKDRLNLKQIDSEQLSQFIDKPIDATEEVSDPFLGKKITVHALIGLAPQACKEDDPMEDALFEEPH